MPASHPIAAFSPYLAGRHGVLTSISAEILAHLDAATSGDSADRARASDLMWLWTLGAYELARTICQSPACFSERFYREAADLKVELERVRVPNTKLERVRYDRKAPPVAVPSDREADLWDGARRDLWVGDPADPVSARWLLVRYGEVLGALGPEDVVMRHEVSSRA